MRSAPSKSYHLSLSIKRRCDGTLVRTSVRSRGFFHFSPSCCQNLTLSPYKIKNPAGRVCPSGTSLTGEPREESASSRDEGVQRARGSAQGGIGHRHRPHAGRLSGGEPPRDRAGEVEVRRDVLDVQRMPAAIPGTCTPSAQVNCLDPPLRRAKGQSREHLDGWSSRGRICSSCAERQDLVRAGG
jgi:hypothetical protein